MPDGGAYRRFGADERPRVLLLLASLHGGGAERVAVHLLNRSDPGLLDIRMGLLQRSGPYLSQVDEARVDISPLGQELLHYEGANSSFYHPDRLLAGALLGPVNTSLMVRSFRPDVVISFLKGMSVVAWLSRAGWGDSKPRWVAREGNNTDMVIDDEMANPLGRAVVKRAIRHCYRAADCVLANSHEMARGLERNHGVDHSKLRVIHNPIDVEHIQAMAAEAASDAPTRPFVVTAGRLESQKAHDLLVRAFASSEACRDMDLVILGKGSQEAALRALAAELGVADRLKLPGFVANPWAYFARSRLFVLPSRWEGFPTVVAEALACGAPALVTDCDFGPSEIVEHGRSGWVVPTGDLQAFRSSMEMMLSRPDLSAGFAARGRQRVLQFNVSSMVESYSTLFIEQAMARRSALAKAGALRLAEA